MMNAKYKAVRVVAAAGIILRRQRSRHEISDIRPRQMDGHRSHKMPRSMKTIARCNQVTQSW